MPRKATRRSGGMKKSAAPNRSRKGGASSYGSSPRPQRRPSGPRVAGAVRGRGKASANTNKRQRRKSR